MINVNVFQYNREIELMSLSEEHTSSEALYLGNMPMYDGHHKLHKGIDNTFRFKVRDANRKPVNLEGKTLVFKMYNRSSRENVLFLYPQITDAVSGQAALVVPTVDTVMLPEGFYAFSMYTVDDETEVEQIIYTDTYDNAKGVIEVVDDVYPEFEESQESSTFFDDGTKMISVVFDGAGKNIKSRSLHTVALYYQDFSGTVYIQGDLSEQPSSSDSDWFDLVPNLVYDKEIVVNGETGVQAYVIKANVNWLRVVYYPDDGTTGTITNVMVRN